MVKFSHYLDALGRSHTFVLLFIISLILLFNRPFLLSVMPIVLVMLLIGLGFAIYHDKQNNIVIVTAMIVAYFTLQFNLSHHAIDPSPFDGKTMHDIELRVVTEPTRSQYGLRFIAILESMNGTTQAFKIKVSLNQPWQHPHFGETWKMQGKLKPIIGLHNALDDRVEKQAFIDGIKGHLVVNKKSKVHQLNRPMSLTTQLRSMALRQLSRLSERMNYPDILHSLLLGDKSKLRYKIKASFQKTGTSHLLAISGMHLAAVGGFFWWVSGFLLRAFNYSQAVIIRNQQSIIVMMAISLYVMLTGFALPTLRAEWMALWGLVVLLMRLKPSAWDALAFSALIILLINPREVLSASFQLSFSSVLLLLLISKKIVDPSRWKQRLKQSLVFSFLSIPISLLVFHSSSPMACLANLLAVPLVTLWILPLGLLGLGVSFLSQPLGKQFLAMSDLGLSGLMRYLDGLASYSVSYLEMPWITPLSSLILLAALLTWVFIKKHRSTIFVMSVGLVSLSPLPSAKPSHGDYWIDVLDVGQGLSVLIRTQQHALLYDTGPSRGSQGNTGKHVVIPYLFKQRLSYLDKIIISHGDDDHQGGFSSIQSHIHYGELLLGEPDRAPVLTFVPCLRGDAWDWDGVHFEVLHPRDNTQGKNNRSCIIKVSNDHHALLLPGDAEKKIEKQLLASNKEILASDILVAGHHGSKTSSSQAFIEAVSPKYFLISSAYLNQYHFPHHEVTKRLHQAKQINTANSGLIHLSVGDSVGLFYQSLGPRFLWNHYY